MKKKSRKEKILFFLNKAHYYNNIKRYKRAAQNICLAKGLWMEYKKDNSKTRKLLSLITNTEEIVINNYITSKEKNIYNILKIDGMAYLDKENDREFRQAVKPWDSILTCLSAEMPKRKVQCYQH